MKLKFDFNNMFTEAIGDKGIDFADVKKNEAWILESQAKVIASRGKGWQEWTELPYISETEINEYIDCGAKIRNSCENFVVLGIGGSALGPLSVHTALGHFRHNELAKEKRNAPRFFVEDNVDPERMTALLDVIDVDNTVFNVITKSGETGETLSQFLIIYDLIKKAAKGNITEKIYVSTTIGKGTLYDLAKQEGFKIFGIGKGVGGRFSVLSSVGLLPFAVMNYDIKEMLRGARDFAETAYDKDLYKNPALFSAALQVLSMRQGKNISVLMPYADSLKYMADFYCQIWGESLGKSVDLNGNEVYYGQTPVKSLGVTDQHSQVQLYTEGPFDKVVTFLSVEKYRTTENIPALPGFAAVEYLMNHTMNELIECERKATEYALLKAKRSNFTVTLPEVNAYTVGQLLMYFMYETAFAGALLNVDTFNQPGVEEGKIATFAMLGRKGYEKKLEELSKTVKLSKYQM